MKQLHIREPWADLAYNSENQLLEDLATRVQTLEAKVRELEVKLAEALEEEREALPAGV
jgi:outer membrane murein-binding lipoprotein Lpp